MRWNRGHDVDARRTVPDRRIVEIRHHEQQRLKRLQRRPMHRDAVEPGDVRVAVRRQFDAIMIVRGEMLMDGRMRVMRVGIVPVGLRQSCPEREARNERSPTIVAARSFANTVAPIMVDGSSGGKPSEWRATALACPIVAC